MFLDTAPAAYVSIYPNQNNFLAGMSSLPMELAAGTCPEEVEIS
jgi:hypothetical protein